MDSSVQNSFRYVVYLNAHDDVVDNRFTNLVKQWLNGTMKSMSNLYGLFLEKELKLKDNQYFFPDIIIETMFKIENEYAEEIPEKNYAFVSINEFQMYYFFIRVANQNNTNSYWRA